MKVFGTLRPGVADALTIANSLCGAVAIGVVIATPWAADPPGDGATLRIVVLIVLVGVVLDVCDGAVARAVGGTPLGPHLDSLADVITFGVAPALAVCGLALRHAVGWEAVVVVVAGLAYVIAALVRLADFGAGRSLDRFFTGMPSPLAAATALSVGLLALDPWLTAGGILLIAWLMVSPIRYPRAKGAVLIVEAIALGVGAAGLLGLFDVRIAAAIAIAACCLVAPVTFAAVTRRRGDAIAVARPPTPSTEP